MYPQFAVILCTTRFVSPYEAICTEHYTQHLVNMLPHPSLQLFPTNAIYDQPVATCTLEIRHNCSSSPQATGSPCDRSFAPMNFKEHHDAEDDAFMHLQ